RPIRNEDSRWYERLRLQGMEGSVLPRGLERRRDARLLLEQVSDGRDQQHLLSAAQGEGAARLGSAGARAILLCDQGEPENHAFRAAQAGVRGDRRISSARYGAARGARRTDSFSAAAEFEEGHGP